MGDVKYRIGLGTVGNSQTGKNDITAKRPVDQDEIITADNEQRFTADSTVHFADGETY